jgi:class 3 adenylate cyclase
MALLTEHGNLPAAAAVPRAVREGTARPGPLGWWHALSQRYPFAMLFVLLLASNVAGSVFSVVYNFEVIARYMDADQLWVFQGVAIPLYNALAYPICLGVTLYLFWPMRRCLRLLRAGEPVEPGFMEFCRRRVINLPCLQLWVNAWGWLPGAVFFPAVICAVAGGHNWRTIFWRFGISFLISAAFTVAQTFFIMQAFLVAYLYPEFFRDTRPEEIRGAWHIPYRWRLLLLWAAVAFVPVLALFVALYDQENFWLAMSLFLTAAVSSFAIFGLAGQDVLRWVNAHAEAMAEVGRGNFEVRIAGQRPDEWGRLTNHFNDMVEALGRARRLRETLGQFVSPEVRDEILERFHGLEGSVQEVTVLFADIRGFTRRSAGEPPERVGSLLNRFLTVAWRAVEEKGGLVNRMLGDGVMALFGATRPRDDHADLAVASALDLLFRLRLLNEELVRQGQAPLVVGIGIHTGPALVGCFGATLESKDGRPRIRREFSAIGETVNLCQRIEQLTKTCGGPILLSEATRQQLRHHHPLHALVCLGPRELPGAPEPLVVHQVLEG